MKKPETSLSLQCVRSLRVGWPLYNGVERLARTIAFLTPFREVFHEAALFTEYGHGYFPVELQRQRLPQIHEALTRFGELGWTLHRNLISKPFRTGMAEPLPEKINLKEGSSLWDNQNRKRLTRTSIQPPAPMHLPYPAVERSRLRALQFPGICRTIWPFQRG